MASTWQLLLGLLLLYTFVYCQQDLELDYSNEYDDVRPQLIYPDEPRLDKQLTSATQQFGENIKNAWQGMVDSFRNYFEDLRDVFSKGFNNTTEDYPIPN